MKKLFAAVIIAASAAFALPAVAQTAITAPDSGVAVTTEDGKAVTSGEVTLVAQAASASKPATVAQAPAKPAAKPVEPTNVVTAPDSGVNVTTEDGAKVLYGPSRFTSEGWLHK